MDKFKKIDKEFCLTDNSVNVYKYRLLTEGLLLDQYKKNPIGFMMHEREGGVLVKWEDFRTEGDRLYGKPVINLSHPKGEDIAAQVENGFINAASMGKIICLAATDDPKLKLKGKRDQRLLDGFLVKFHLLIFRATIMHLQTCMILMITSWISLIL